MAEFEDDINDWHLNPEHISINMEDFQFVWFDPDLITSKSPLNVRYYRNRIKQLNTAVQFFTDLYTCTNFIKTVKKEKIFLIVSASIAEQILTKTHRYQPLVAVFIFTQRQDQYQKLLDQYKKVVGIYSNRDHLIDSIGQTMKQIEKQFIFPTFFKSPYQKSFRELSKEQATFFWYQLLFHVLKEFPTDENEKTKFLEICEKYYRDNPLEMMHIEAFREQYQSNQAIEWYTRDIFLYKVINKALRDDNIY